MSNKVYIFHQMHQEDLKNLLDSRTNVVESIINLFLIKSASDMLLDRLPFEI